ncbi:Spy/CpxP family protein refolding chaperone [Jannaschia aquimarina]|uniref:Uncharacterized protein n=1 Tax=Jannaschia aquimarina TaxID=935700 RepID=A0A0D1EN54_9RHOB|nr:hypothetical protein [Jannaschia aquimarina]KIT17130.1 hypothetical protein jaqu_11720 [Jannaschia aquimarina]SNS47518.1 hypothetical protein SAMN05421775_10193 [Jannaschia aquimarina]
MSPLRNVLTVLVLLATPVGAEEGPPPSPYAGEQAREIASLSADDLAELARGDGWGLARAAELNGVPGPAHLLELADEIGLDAGQRSAIAAIRDSMRKDAVAAGERFVAAERALDRAFEQTGPDRAELARLVQEAGDARAALRLVHLSAHLGTAPLLTQAQIDLYAVLRGYAEDPCETVPEGHDVEMWRRHNGCG